MLNAGILVAHRALHPVGEVQLGSASGTWVAPAGVTRVCVVVIGRGGDGIQFGGQRRGGGGGALVYKNDIAVIPGQAYNYTVGALTSIFGVEAWGGGAGSSGDAGGYGGSGGGTGAVAFSGGRGGMAYAGEPANGGGAGGYLAGGAEGSGVGSSVFGHGGDSPNYGAGGESIYSGTAAQGRPGRIRIMWGSGRSFPYNAAAIP